MAETIVTAQQIAELLGVTVQAVRNQADQGFMVRADKRGRFLLEPSIRKYCAHLRDMASGRGDPGSAASLAQERAKLAARQSELAELKAAQMRGELVPAVDVEARWRGALAGLRSRLLAVPSRVRTRRPHLSREEIEAVEQEIREALTELAGDGG